MSVLSLKTTYIFQPTKINTKTIKDMLKNLRHHNKPTHAPKVQTQMPIHYYTPHTIYN